MTKARLLPFRHPVPAELSREEDTGRVPGSNGGVWEFVRAPPLSFAASRHVVVLTSRSFRLPDFHSARGTPRLCPRRTLPRLLDRLLRQSPPRCPRRIMPDRPSYRRSKVVPKLLPGRVRLCVDRRTNRVRRLKIILLEGIDLDFSCSLSSCLVVPLPSPAQVYDLTSQGPCAMLALSGKTTMDTEGGRDERGAERGGGKQDCRVSRFQGLQ